MKLGYACINTSIDCTTNSTFRLKNYSEKKLIEKVENNLNCFMRILKWNANKKIHFFRLGSSLIPFASHEICKFNWQDYFKEHFQMIGDYIKKNKIRITMHPDQFVIINALNKNIVKRSIKELEYHCKVLDLLNLDSKAKIIIHVGGVYKDKKESIKRFIENYKKLPLEIKKRLVIENDDTSYSLKDCLEINKKTRIPIVFDIFHHECLNNGETTQKAFLLAKETWRKKDGNIILHYSSQKKGCRKGSHSETIDLKNYKKLLKELGKSNFYLMLEIKDKEKSLLKIRDSFK